MSSEYATAGSVCEIPFTLRGGHAITRFNTFQIAGEHPRREIIVTLLGPATMRDVIASFVPP